MEDGKDRYILVTYISLLYIALVLVWKFIIEEIPLGGYEVHYEPP